MELGYDKTTPCSKCGSPMLMDWSPQGTKVWVCHNDACEKNVAVNRQRELEGNARILGGVIGAAIGVGIRLAVLGAVIYFIIQWMER